MIPPVNGLHIEATNICTLKCAGCARTRFIEQWPQHWKNHSVDIDALVKFLDIDLTGKPIHLCGNYGDPIYHPELARLVDELKKRNARIIINTNGSHRSQEWWEQLVERLSSDDTIIFAVDGTPENFTQYRVNGDWETIKHAMEICVASACKTMWKYIPFAYNQDDIDTVKNLSVSLGIDNFKVEPSDRFDEKTKHLMPSTQFLGNKWVPQTMWKNQSSEVANVNPRCNKGIDHFITAEGFYSPCCFIADHRFYYKTQFGKQKNQYNINDTTLSDILNRPKVIEFYQTLDQHPSCQFNCPS